jgi:hypothetical protein
VASEEWLSALQYTSAVMREWTRPRQEPTSALAPDQVADVIAHDRRCGCQRDHNRDL